MSRFSRLKRLETDPRSGLPEAFVWIDDGKHEIDVALVGGGERIQVANGRMREFSGE